MGRPRKWRPPPRPVGRPRKPVDLTAQLAKMSDAELVELQRYQQSITAPKNGRFRMGDVREDGKVFMWYIPYWAPREVYERHKKQLRDRVRVQAQAAKANT